MSDEGGGASRTTDPAAGSSAATDVSLREYFGLALRYQDRNTRERFGWLMALGAVIWFFIERHLAQLNNSHARLDVAVARNVSSDTYEANEQQRKSELLKLDEWRKDVDRDRTQSISRDEFQRDNKTDRRGTVGQWIAAASVVVAVAGIVAAVIVTH